MSLDYDYESLVSKPPEHDWTTHPKHFTKKQTIFVSFLTTCQTLSCHIVDS